DLSPLYEMKNIKKITMKYLKGSIDFSKFQKLETLYITKADAEIDILNIDTLVDLLLRSSIPDRVSILTLLILSVFKLLS
ncbi:toxin, partial [Salmonella enterica]|nr:toxin [Salmonella enterica]